MKSMRQSVAVWLVIALVGVGFTAQAQRRPYRITDRQVEQIIRRIEVRADSFRQGLEAALDRNNRLDGTSTEDEINGYVRDFATATDTLRDRFNRRASVAADVELVLTQAANIGNFLSANRLNARVQSDWSLLRTDLNALASAYGVSARWDQRTPPLGGAARRSSRSGNRQAEELLSRVETSASRFRTSLDLALDRSNRRNVMRDQDQINEHMRQFENASNQLRNSFNSRTAVAADVEPVLEHAAGIDQFMRTHRLTPRAQDDWALLRTDLDALANAYRVTARWDRNALPATGGASLGTMTLLTGTFRLDPTRSDNPRDAADRATRSLPAIDRQRIYDALLARLEAPELLAIERRGTNVTIASSRAPQTTFEADGRERSEQLPNGMVARVRANLTGNQLVVNSTGDRENDFTVTFDPIDNGRTLHVTRRIFSNRINQPVVVQNVYTRTSQIAQMNIYDGAQVLPAEIGNTSGDFIVSNNEVLTAMLDTNISTKQAQEGDRFTMTVREPAQYEGAVIEGRISDVSRSGRISGRSGLTFNFDSIRLRNGRTYKFAGFVNSLRTPSGETVKVDNEGTVKDDNQTERTVQRAAIGTAVGAIIGAIAGGGKGAAIGAVIGAGAGAGSVYVEGRDDLDLISGTEVMIRASAPGNR